jgi:putative nucleotidyltransferase with HDIG domain
MRRPLPVFDATHDRDTGDDAKELPHLELLGWVLTAERSYTPFGGGRKKGIVRTADAKIRLYVGGLALAAVALAASLAFAGFGPGSVWIVVGLAGANAVAERGGVHIGRTTELTIWILPALFAAVLFGPIAGGIVGAASMIGDAEIYARQSERSPRLKFIAYASTRFIVGAAMGLSAHVATALVPSTVGGLVTATLVGSVIGEALDVLFAGVTAKMRGRNLRNFARSMAPVVLTAAPTYGPIVAALAIAYVSVSPWTAPLFFIPALAAQRLYQLYHAQRRLADDLAEANDALARANLSFAGGLIATLDARDRYTAGHSAAVAIYSRDIAARMGMSDELQEQAYLCGLVHDIGKVGLPAGLLEKPGALTLDERRQMQEHSAIGERILRQVDSYSDIATIVRHHHERMDGEGYPDGLQGDSIPPLSRIIAVADAYNAMTSDRPYRDAMPSRVARLRLAQAVESQFDTTVVAAFEAILASADESYRVGRDISFLAFTTVSDQPEELGSSSDGKMAEVA